MELLREMFILLRAGGIEEAKAKEMLIDTLFPGQIFSGYAQRYIDQPDSVKMGPLSGKDRRNCLEAAERLGVELPLMQFLSDHELP
jgi:3-hydroxyisobutyrate dehydrogenase-like beta-hydroxyacid dehydrogenase